MPATTYMAPAEYIALTMEEVAARSNGCGPQSWKIDLVPDELIGVDFGECCNIHDVEYGLGQDKALADARLGGNMILACLRQHPHRLAEFLPLVGAYVLAVSTGGDEHFGGRNG